LDLALAPRALSPISQGSGHDSLRVFSEKFLPVGFTLREVDPEGPESSIARRGGLGMAGEPAKHKKRTRRQAKARLNGRLLSGGFCAGAVLGPPL